MKTGNCIIIQNTEGKYLMQFRDDTPGINSPLMWEFFGGSSEEGETPVQGAARELQEELGISVEESALEEVAMHKMDGVDEYVYKLNYTLEWSDFVVNEGAGAAFLRKEELLQLSMSERARFFVEKYI